MANEEHLAILKNGVQAWNQWREENPDVEPDLRDADLREIDLIRVNFRVAKLSGVKLISAQLQQANLSESHLVRADLSRANLGRARLYAADLSGARLTESVLENAYLREAELAGADLRTAQLSQTILIDANLNGANLRGASLVGTVLFRTQFAEADLSNSFIISSVMAGLDLSTTRGLETVELLGPSSIGLDTIYLSRGRIPEVFLRGAGVPEEFIISAKSVAANPIEFHSCFISYSSNDQQFAERLYTDLQAKNVRCWFAPHDVRGGRKLHEQIDQAIRMHQRVLLILSSHSMGSEWVKTEIAKARKREMQEKKQVLFPVRLVSFEKIREWECFDADTGKDSAREIREYFIPDFSDWKNHDCYNAALGRLLKDLKAV